MIAFETSATFFVKLRVAENEFSIEQKVISIKLLTILLIQLSISSMKIRVVQIHMKSNCIKKVVHYSIKMIVELVRPKFDICSYDFQSLKILQLAAPTHSAQLAGDLLG